MDDDSKRRAVLSVMRRRYIEYRVSLFGSLLLGLLGGSAVYRLQIGVVLLPAAGMIALVFLLGLIQSSVMLSWAAQGLTSRELASPSSGRGTTLIVINIVMGLVGGFLMAYMTSRILR